MIISSRTILSQKLFLVQLTAIKVLFLNFSMLNFVFHSQMSEFTYLFKPIAIDAFSKTEFRRFQFTSFAISETLIPVSSP